MKLQFIGTGNMQSTNYNACLLVNDSILIDTPPGLSKTIIQRNINFNNLKTIIITHQHIDHYFDLPIIIWELINHKSEAINVLANQDIIKNFKTLMKLAFPNVYKDILKKININFLELKENVTYSVSDISISAVPMIHGELKNCFGVILKNSDTSLGYTGDATFSENVNFISQECKHVILDCNNEIGNSEHMGIDNIGRLCEQFPNTKFYPNHMSDTAIVKIPNFDNLILPHDNDIITL